MKEVTEDMRKLHSQWLALWLVLRTKHEKGDQVKQNTTGGLCGT